MLNKFIKGLCLPNLKVGFILLWGLFFYDVFWVYGTDVMVTVAKNINAPIKILFPIDLLSVPPKLSLLGLGDIVIPVLIYFFFNLLGYIYSNLFKI
jgi:minor histocompatibility antigen H13